MIIRNEIMFVSLTLVLLNPFSSTNAQQSEQSSAQIRTMLPRLNEYIQAHPNDTKAYMGRGLAYSQLQEFQKSIDDLSKAIELDPKNSNIYFSRGTVYFKEKEYKKAIADNNIAIQLDPRNALAYSNRSASYIGLGINKYALADALASIRLDPSNPAPYDNAGEACYKLGKYADSINYYNKGLYRNSQMPEAFFFRGMSYQKLGNKAQANKDLLRARQLGYKPDSPTVFSVDMKK